MRLLLDAMLGRLATYLRMAGHDTAYVLDRGVETDESILAVAHDEGRTLVTRDASLAARADHAIHIRGTEIEDKLREVRAAGVELSLDRPERCSRCNAAVERVATDRETPEYAPRADDTPVWRCSACGQHYWRGSHWDDVRDRLASI